jgi:hypothetical protein
MGQAALISIGLSQITQSTKMEGTLICLLKSKTLR